VTGVEMNGKFKAYPFVELSKGPGQVDDTAGGTKITIRFEREHRTGTVYDATGKKIPRIIAFLFAWHAFHSDIELYSSK
jgi:hypothetical protein